MAMWHCPHCGAPQAESARCWVCRRSSTTCSTCRHFRASLAADVGYCALDARRRPLTGLELRACWTQGSTAAGTPTPSAAHPEPASAALGIRSGAPARRFVPLDEVVPRQDPEPVTDAVVARSGDPFESWETRTSLFGELER